MGGAYYPLGASKGAGSSSSVEYSSRTVEGKASQRAIGELRDLVAGNMEALSDDDILIMVSDQLNDIDQTIRGHLSGMKQSAARGRMLAGALTALNNQVAARSAPGSTTNLEQPPDLNARFSYVDESGVQVETTVGAVFGQFGITASSSLKEADVRTMRDSLEQKMSAIRTETEGSQLNLQQMMSRRSQLLQITSNVLASRNESRKSIAQNIRA